MTALFWLKRHPFPVSAHFDHSLVLTYALPSRVLRPLLAPGLDLDILPAGEEEYGFVAIALVQTRGLRPAFLPRALGRNFFLSGYRVFARFCNARGTRLRGLRILRSDTDKPLMAFFGNLFTHYNYNLAKVSFRADGSTLAIEVATQNAHADLKVRADLTSLPAPLPPNSVFQDVEQAKRFAGPLPYTFDYEAQTHSLIAIKGVRKKWNPQPVEVQVEKCTFFERPEFQGVTPILSNAFYLSDIPYRWEAGRREPLKTHTIN